LMRLIFAKPHRRRQPPIAYSSRSPINGGPRFILPAMGVAAE
jgi:hypothetical protein